jgi:superfamily II DNA or RNA helicase
MTRQTIESGFCECGCGRKTKIAKRTMTSRGWVKGQPLRFILNHSSKAEPKRRFQSFEKAREYAHTLGLKSGKEWFDWYRANQPQHLPGDPSRCREYKEHWVSWGDWLGTGRVANGQRKFLPFTEARDFARKLGLKTQDEWVDYCRSGKKPGNIPVRPAQIYKDEWVSTADWLGSWGLGSWTAQAVSGYLKSIAPEIPNMRDASLVALIIEAGLDAPLREILGTPSMARVIAALRENGDGVAERFRRQGRRRFDVRHRDLPVAEIDVFDHDEVEVNEDNVHIADRLRDKASPEFIEHLIQEKLNGLIVKYINGDKNVSKIMKQEGGEFYQEIRRRFESEISGVMAGDVSDWKLRDKKTGTATEPNLMQRYIAHKLKNTRTWCNWSGTGTGKTGSAGLASYVIGSRFTVVLCPNSTAKQWAGELKLAFPNSTSVTKVADARHGVESFLILNYEKFQSEKSSSSLVRAIVELRPDLIVLDEIHLLKRRDQHRSSIRREGVLGMLQQLPNARVLGMTATPVINELREGVSLLEAVTGRKQDLKTFRSIANALNLHFALLQHGLCYKPEYQQSLAIKVTPFVENSVFPALRRIAEEGSNDVLAIEQTVLPTKLERVRDWIEPGTLIYLEFVEGLVPVVRRYVESLGLNVGEYTGDTRAKDRDVLKEKFISGEIDVLIGSQAVALGVDGLQQRCNRLIVLSLPWTHAAFQQLYGRLYRQGSAFAEVEVLIPQLVTTTGGGRWSWDEARYSVIEHKKTLSDTATDGYVPTSEHLSRKEFAKKAMDALRVMIDGVQNDTVLEIIAPSTEDANAIIGQERDERQQEAKGAG